MRFRYKTGTTTILGILPGTRQENEKPKISSVLALVADEMRDLSTHGVEVYDAADDCTLTVRVLLLTATSDYRGWETMLGIAGAPFTTHACYRCWLPGTKGPSKILYGQGFRWLERDDSLRAKAKTFNTAVARTATGYQLQPLTGSEGTPEYRSKQQLLAKQTVRRSSIEALLYVAVRLADVWQFLCSGAWPHWICWPPNYGETLCPWKYD